MSDSFLSLLHFGVGFLLGMITAELRHAIINHKK